MTEENNLSQEQVSENTENNLIEELRSQLSEAKEQMLRAVADSENTRKRMEKQMEDLSKYAVSNFAKDMINVSENIHRALSSVPDGAMDDPNYKSLYDGVEMTRKELISVFEKNKISIISPAIGDTFDHNFHQAVAHIDNPELKSGQISGVMQNGYLINDRLLRPAMVSVVK